MGFRRVPLFRKRQFAAEIIVTCVRWYLRFSLSLRDVEELMAERGLSVDHTTVGRWTQTYARRCSADCEGRSSRNDRPGTWTRLLYGSPAVGCTCSVPSIAAGKRWISTYPKLATVKLRSASCDERWLIPTTAHHTCSPETDCEVIPRPFENCRTKVNSVAVVGIEPDATRIIASNPTTATSNGACGACMARGP